MVSSSTTVTPGLALLPPFTPVRPMCCHGPWWVGHGEGVLKSEEFKPMFFLFLLEFSCSSGNQILRAGQLTGSVEVPKLPVIECQACQILAVWLVFFLHSDTPQGSHRGGIGSDDLLPRLRKVLGLISKKLAWCCLASVLSSG